MIRGVIAAALLIGLLWAWGGPGPVCADPAERMMINLPRPLSDQCVEFVELNGDNLVLRLAPELRRK